MSICLITRFKNERHIMYEFIHHYLEEGINHFILIDDKSNDDYRKLNTDWLDSLIKKNIISIHKSKNGQYKDYNLHLKKIKKYKWAIICDMDEFFFSPQPKTTLKQILNKKLNNYDYIRVPWKEYTHFGIRDQPKSIINSNFTTHNNKIAFNAFKHSKGYKSIIKTKNINSISIHHCKAIKNTNVLRINNCHNNLIQNNHYKTQSDEYLFGVKEIRGGGVHKHRYYNYKQHINKKFNKQCNLLYKKKKKLIKEILAREQIKPLVYTNSSFYKNEMQ